ncbi:hypothetical protein [Luteibacter sp.]|jgi:hypothetical protein|uniref:hypothetical protein n=1 Tax=Luteibacter sp. TaxID=1886636 RepID=UPI002F408A54
MNASATQQVAVATQPRQQLDLSPQTFDQAIQFCDYLADSDLVPKDFKGKPANCLIAIQWGAELGLKPLQAIQNIAIINGRPALWGDAVIALVRSSPLCEYVRESEDGSTAVCRVKRRGEDEEVRTFSVEDAKTAGLLGKSGTWTQYPKRMRQMRARAFALRDVFPDVLRGIPIAEEIMDIQQGDGQRAVTVRAEPAAYPAEDFERNLPVWLKAIADGRRTADDLIAMAETKGSLTEEQKKLIRGANKPADDTGSEQ